MPYLVIKRIYSVPAILQAVMRPAICAIGTPQINVSWPVSHSPGTLERICVYRHVRRHACGRVDVCTKVITIEAIVIVIYECYGHNDCDHYNSHITYSASL